MTAAEADTLLTAMAKREHDPLAVDVDEHGAVWYRPAGAGTRLRVEGPGVRVDAGASGGHEADEDARAIEEADPAASAARRP